MQCVIFHGSFGSKDGNWFPWLKRELATMGHEVFLEQYPVDNWGEIEKKGKNNSETIENLDSWLAYFEKNTLPKLKKDGDIVFFGHSLAPLFILQLISQFNLQLKGAVFVSPFLEALNQKETWQFDVVNSTFYKTDFDWIKLKILIPHSYVLYGTNDPYVPNKFPIAFAKNTKSKMISIKNGEHLGGELKEFPLLLELFKKIGK